MEAESSWDKVTQDFSESAGILHPQPICARVQSLRRFLVQQGVELSDTCKYLAPKDTAVINKVLQAANLQLREWEHGFEVSRANCAVENDVSGESLVDAAFLFCWLLRVKVDVTSVDIRDTPLLSRLPVVLKLGLSSSNSIRNIKVGLWEDNTEKHGTYLAEGLHVGLPLEVYCNRGIHLTDAAAARVADVLRGCSATLKSIFISSGTVPGPNKNNVKLLLEALSESFKLHALFVAGCDVGKEGKIFAKVLEANPSLKKLTLRKVNEDALKAVAETVRGNTSLESLEMSEDYSSSGSIALTVADIMRDNRTITNLNLNALNIDNAGARALAGMLAVNTTLKKLSLENNRINGEGAVPFADVLRTNTSLEELSLYGNDAASSTLEALTKTIESNLFHKLESTHQMTEHPAGTLHYEGSSGLDDSVLQDLTHALKEDAYSSHNLQLCLDFACSSFHMGQMFNAIGSSSIVTELFVDAVMYIDTYAARQLSQAFSKTVSLKSVHFQYEFDDPNVVMELLVGLSRNRSIRKVNLGFAFFYEPTPEVLKNLFISNNTLRSFHIYDRSIRTKAMKPILEGLSANYALTNVELGTLDYEGDDLFRVQGFVCRNERLLGAAVQFVLGKSQDDEAREAYRKLCSTVSLVEEVMNICSVSEDIAKDLVRASGIST